MDASFGWKKLKLHDLCKKALFWGFFRVIGLLLLSP